MQYDCNLQGMELDEGHRKVGPTAALKVEEGTHLTK